MTETTFSRFGTLGARINIQASDGLPKREEWLASHDFERLIPAKSPDSFLTSELAVALIEAGHINPKVGTVNELSAQLIKLFDAGQLQPFIERFLPRWGLGRTR